MPVKPKAKKSKTKKVLVASNSRTRPRRKRDSSQASEEVVKVIIMVSGSATDGWIIYQPQGAAPSVLPAAATPAGFTPNPGVNCGNAPASAAPYFACEQRYTGPLFKNAGWQYHSGGQILSLASLEAQFATVVKLNPTAVVVHYVGHGGYANSITYWSLRGFNIRYMPWKIPGGPKITIPVAIPNDGIEIGQLDLAQVKTSMQTAFPNADLTLITDGCEQQEALDLGAAGFRVIVCDETKAPGWLGGIPRIVNEGFFSTFWSRSVVPTCFAPDDAKQNLRPAVFQRVNKAMANIPVPAAGGPQVAACSPAP